MNISSLIVDVRPESVPDVRRQLDAWPGIDVHAATPEGKLVVTIESDSDGQTAETFSQIGAIEGVMSVAMVYHQFEPEPETDLQQEACHG
jgi:nitrate reductase NapD